MKQKTTAALLVAALALLGCSSDGGSDESTAAPGVSQDTALAAPDIDRDEDLVTAQSLINAWDAAGLALGEIRNNTNNGSCSGEMAEFCTALLTTDYVSVRVFVNAADAAEWTGPGREALAIGRVNASFGGDSDFWPFDTAPYIDVMQDTIG